MNDLMTFNNKEFGSIRTLEIDGEPWFVGKDVAAALGYSNSRKAIGDHVDDEDKGVTKRDTLGGAQDLAIINESGLYSLILSSKLPSAKRFKHWVTSEVLPAIRKTGSYSTQPKGTRLLALAVLEADKIIKQQEAEIQQMQPKALFADAVEASNDAILIGELAKLIKQNGHEIGQNRLFEWMRQHGYLICRKGQDFNMPTQRAMEMKLFRIKERTIANPDGSMKIIRTTLVTGRGQQYFVNKFLNASGQQMQLSLEGTD